MNTVMARNIPLIATRLRMGKGVAFHKRSHSTLKGKTDDDQSSSCNMGYVTWERFLDHHIQNTNRFAIIEKDVAVLGGLSEAVKKLGDKVEKLEAKIHTEFKTLRAEIGRHDGMMRVALALLLIPATGFCAKVGYDYYVEWRGGGEE